jgi:Cof subfamily protein (haloacid dehalogenase superfamily)
MTVEKNSKVIFVSDLDGTLLNSSGKVSEYSKKELNELIKKGASITIATARTPATVVELMKGIEFNLPLITMNGGALYDLKSQSYIDFKNIEYVTSRKILDVFDNYKLNCFAYTIVNDKLNVYHSDFTTLVEQEFYSERKNLALKKYIYSKLPEGQGVVHFSALNTSDIIEKVYNDIIKLDCSDEFNAVYYKDIYNEGYYFLELCSKKASKKNAVIDIKKRLLMDKVIVFGDNFNDKPMIEVADYSYVVENGAEAVKAVADCIIGTNDNDSVVRTIRTYLGVCSS